MRGGVVCRSAVAGLVLGAGCFVDPTIGDETSSTGDASTSSATGAITTTAMASGSTSAPTSTSTSTSTSAGPGSSSGSSGGETGTSGAPVCPGPCEAPPSPCFSAVGECVLGECVYAPMVAGTRCEDGDACTSGESCDGMGGCGGGAPMVCEGPNSVGTCSGGLCGGWSCTGAWENCDGDWANGCEVPTGVPNTCSKAGLGDPDSCWTAYCGSSDGAKVNFGTFYCRACPNCHVPAAGLAQWCSSELGVWFPAAQGVCGDFEDVVCGP